MKGLMLHCGSHLATPEVVAGVITPSGTPTWYPIPHLSVVESVMAQVEQTNLTVESSALALSTNGARLFGMLELKSSEDHSLVIGFRNSHDKSFPISLAVGSRVFVCDNLAFSSEIVINRKHTRFAERDIPQLMCDAFGRLGDHRGIQNQRIAAYKEEKVSMFRAHDLMIQAMNNGVIAASKLPAVLDEWRFPSFIYEDGYTEENQSSQNSLWTLFNAFTFVLQSRESNLFDLPKRTRVLHGLCDVAAGLEFDLGETGV